LGPFVSYEEKSLNTDPEVYFLTYSTNCRSRDWCLADSRSTIFYFLKPDWLFWKKPDSCPITSSYIRRHFWRTFILQIDI